MDKAAMYESMMESMQTDALFNLYSGIVTPVDRQILADMPLPSDMVDPFASQDVDPLSVMNLTYVSLSGWIADAKQEKYYTERFVNLSKLVMKGVATMCRGLVTLHQRGEDLSAAPMQIGDLISVGSYHLRKSYLGVVQFSAKHPEIGERLLLNQLGWSTTLLRLYKTKEKLAKPISNEEIRRKNEELSGQDESPAINAQNEKESTKQNELPDGNDNISSFLPLTSSFEKGFSPLAEPGAFSALRAYSSLDGSGRFSSVRKTAAGSSASLTGSREAKTEASLPKTDAEKKEIRKEDRRAENAAEETGKAAAAAWDQEVKSEEQINRTAENEPEKNNRETAAAGNQNEELEEQISRTAENEPENNNREPAAAGNQGEKSEEHISPSAENGSEKIEPEPAAPGDREEHSKVRISLSEETESITGSAAVQNLFLCQAIANCFFVVSAYAAIQTVCRILRDGAYSSIELAHNEGLSSADRALYAAIVRTVVERKLTLDYVLAHPEECQQEDPEFDAWCDRVILALEESKQKVLSMRET